MNRLEQELSPYLLAWAEDPVDWYPWGPEAFARARQEGKPLLICIGSTPRQRELPRGSGTVARLTGRYFVPVQVDSQEYPGVAALYAQGAGLLTGETDHPLGVLADWRGNPFYITGALREVELAGLLSGVALHWSGDASAYERIGAELGRRLSGLGASYAREGEPEKLFDTHYKRLKSRYDRDYGGFGQGDKGLVPQNLLFLLAYYRRTGEREALNMACHTLRQMALGAVRDMIGGGFFRGTRDRQWKRPIPEKRLLDQAWMLEVYTRCYQLTGTELFAAVAKETADYVIRELRHAAGGFYTAQWWDNEAYLLTDREVYGQLGGTDGAVFCRQYAIGPEPSAPHLLQGDCPEEDSVLLHDLRMKLYRRRLESCVPNRDEKVLTGWNGLMIAALARAGRVLGVERYLTAAVNAEDFLRRRLVRPMELRRYWCHGTAAGDGALEDYAGYAAGLLELYASGCGGDALRNAAKLMARADALFSDWEHGGYFVSRDSRHLPANPKEPWDGAAPSAWSVALNLLVRLSKEIPHQGLARRTEEQLRYAAGVARSYDCGSALTTMMEG